MDIFEIKCDDCPIKMGMPTNKLFNEWTEAERKDYNSCLECNFERSVQEVLWMTFGSKAI